MNEVEYAKLYHEMQRAWKRLLIASTDLLIINRSHPEYEKFYKAELKVRKYFVDWRASGDFLFKETYG